jgi:hypothetical protein
VTLAQDLTSADIGHVADHNEIHGLLQGTPWVNVKDDPYGALADGSDDTAKIQAAINALPANGGLLFFPPGDYRVTQLDLSGKSAVYFVGVGRRSNPSTTGGGSCIYATSGSGSIILADAGGAINHLGPHFRDIRVEDRQGNRTCVSIRRYNNWGFEYCHIAGFGGTTTGIGIKIESDTLDASYGVIRDCNIANHAKGVQVLQGASAYLISGCYLVSSVASARLIEQGGDRAKIIGNTFEAGAGSGVTGIYIAHTDARTSQIDDNSFERVLVGVDFPAQGSLTYFGTIVSNLSTTGNAAGEIGVRIGSNVDGVELHGIRGENLGVGVLVEDNGTHTFRLGSRRVSSPTLQFLNLGGVYIGSGTDAPTQSVPDGSLYLRKNDATNPIYIRKGGAWVAMTTP